MSIQCPLLSSFPSRPISRLKTDHGVKHTRYVVPLRVAGTVRYLPMCDSLTVFKPVASSCQSVLIDTQPSVEMYNRCDWRQNSSQTTQQMKMPRIDKKCKADKRQSIMTTCGMVQCSMASQGRSESNRCMYPNGFVRVCNFRVLCCAHTAYQSRHFPLQDFV